MLYKPWVLNIRPIVEVGRAKPPVNLNGKESGVEDSGMLKRIGRS